MRLVQDPFGLINRVETSTNYYTDTLIFPQHFSIPYTCKHTFLARCVGLHAFLSRASKPSRMEFPPRLRSLMDREKPLLLMPVKMPTKPAVTAPVKTTVPFFKKSACEGISMIIIPSCTVYVIVA